jgi:predicted nucleic-acid-binding protein
VISVDTNVLLRYLLQDDKDQAPKANRLFSSTEKILITDIVLVEALWTLKGKKYNLGKQDQLMVLSQLFKEPNVIFEDRQTVWSAMNSFRASEKIKVGNKKKEADFADALIVEKSKSICNERGESFDGLFTFDVASLQFDGSKEPK